MKTKIQNLFLTLAAPALVIIFNSACCLAQAQGTAASAGTSGSTHAAIPWDQIGAKAGADYHGDGLSVVATATGARLRCLFQRLDGEATAQGLWLTSTVTSTANDRFRVVATAIGGQALPPRGEVKVDARTVQFTRPGLVEEYAASMDGVRQDFVVPAKPAGGGKLKVELAVDGARVEPAAYGAQLVLEQSGRKIAYSRLHVTDAKGKELPASIQVTAAGSSSALTIVVNDADAVYPVRIDPTFSDANWVSLGGLDGADGTISAAVIDDKGNLYIGGSFTVVGNVVAKDIAKWDGSRWSPLGLGMYGYSVYALAVWDGNLIAGGDFTMAGDTNANCIAKWDGRSWSPLGTGMSGQGVRGEGPYVTALAVSSDGTLFAGGDFTMADGNAANYIAQWNGSTWSPLGSGMDFPVYALAVSGGTLFAGGEFEMAGGNFAPSIAQWDGSSWSPLGSSPNGLSLDGLVEALVVSSDGTLYVGGAFTTAYNSDGTTVPANDVAQWDGSNWSPLGPGISGAEPPNTYPWVYTLAVSSDGILYVGGDFTTAGGNPANNIAQWNGSSWSPLGSGTSGPDPGASPVQALAVSGSTLFAGGGFSTAGGNPANNIAQWDGSRWSSLGSGMNVNNWVDALAVSGDTLFAGGLFTTAGGKVVNGVAQWNGSAWSPLGTGMGGVPPGATPQVSALAVSGTNLYAAGYFTTAGGIAASNIARWNGSTWSPLGSGVGGEPYGDSSVLALAVSGNTLFVGGYFTTAGGIAASNIAQWNGSNWSPLGSGMAGEYGGVVYALAVSGGTLFAGGNFTTAGGTSANSIAQWNGSNWAPLGAGVSGDFHNVYALAVSGTNLYAGGGFTAAGGNPANYIAQWNGSTWSPLGSGMTPHPFAAIVSALAVSGDTLFAGGEFTIAGGTSANYIAQWDGSSWSPLGSGMDFPVYALAVSGDRLYAGGMFTTADGKASAYAAEARLPRAETKGEHHWHDFDHSDDFDGQDDGNQQLSR